MKIQTLSWILLLLTSCEFQSTHHKTILVVAIENLGASEISCHRDLPYGNTTESRRHGLSGFEVLCQSFTQFTRSYTPSILSAPALASVMTARYPHLHGVRDNHDFLSAADHETLAEIAHAQNWSTAFISGGAPILRKTGLSQGFDLFDDSAKLSVGHWYRPLKDLTKIYLQHLKESRSQNSLAFLVAQDLLFPEEQTQNSVGEIRNQTFESQLDEIDEKLGILFEELQKKPDLWNNMTIVLMGLNGPSRSFHKVEPAENLFSERSQVSLFLKMPGERELSNVDIPVSLVDVGSTLLELVGGISSNHEPLRLESLSKLAQKKNLPSESNRFIPVESAWAHWHRQSPLQWGFRWGSSLCLKTKPWTCYDSRTDRTETDAIKRLPSEVASRFDDLEALRVSIEKIPTNDLPNSLPLQNFEACQNLSKATDLSQISAKTCAISEIQELLAWVEAEANPKIDFAIKETLKKKFFQSFSYLQLDLELKKINEKKNFIFDLNRTRENEWQLISQILDSNFFLKYKLQAQRAIQQNSSL